MNSLQARLKSSWGDNGKGSDKPNMINLLNYFFDDLPVVCRALATSIGEDDVDRR